MSFYNHTPVDLLLFFSRHCSLTGMEFTGISWRTCYGVVVSIAFTLGMCTIPLVAYLVGDWVYLGLVTSLPALIMIPCFWSVRREREDVCGQ